MVKDGFVCTWVGLVPINCEYVCHCARNDIHNFERIKTNAQKNS